MRNYQVVIEGKTPLLMHHDNIAWADFMEDWNADPENKKLSKPGEDRTPAWRWMGCCYHDGKVLAIPQANIMRSLMEGSAQVPVPGGRSGKTFKAQSQSGMMCVEANWPLLIGGKTVAWADIERLKDETSFAEHQAAVNKLGFELFVKRAKIGARKHVRVRPKFNESWQLRGTIAVWDDQITEAVLAQILSFAGQYKGLGDWRPGAKTPGPYGTFTAQVKKS